MIKRRVRLNRKTRSNSQSLTSAPARRRLFGPPQLLAGEDAAAYHEFLARVHAAVKPVDVIDEMLIHDVVCSEWQVLRSRRWNLNLIRARQVEELKAILNNDFEGNPGTEVDYLAGILQDHLPEEEANAARTLASMCVRGDRGAVDTVNKILAGMKLNMDQVRADAWSQNVKELMREYARNNPDAVTAIEELLADDGRSIDTITAGQLADHEYLESIERIDRLGSTAEGRRNASLREIERRRAVLGQARRSVE
jgi:hypothetical protein